MGKKPNGILRGSVFYHFKAKLIFQILRLNFSWVAWRNPDSVWVCHTWQRRRDRRAGSVMFVTELMVGKMMTWDTACRDLRSGGSDLMLVREELVGAARPPPGSCALFTLFKTEARVNYRETVAQSCVSGGTHSGMQGWFLIRMKFPHKFCVNFNITVS